MGGVVRPVSVLEALRALGVSPRALTHEECRGVLRQVFGGVRAEVTGLEHIPAAGPALVLTNHTGWEEILLMALRLPRPFKVLSFYELLYLDERVSWERIFATEHARHYSPLIRTGAQILGRALGSGLRAQLRAFGVIPTHVYNDGSPPTLGQNGVREVRDALLRGELVLIYPEADIRPDGVMAPFRPGLGMLLRLLRARGVNVPVVAGAQRSKGAISFGLGNRFVPRVTFGPAVWFDAEGAAHELASGEAPPEVGGETRQGVAARAFDRRVVAGLQARVAGLLSGLR